MKKIILILIIYCSINNCDAQNQFSEIKYTFTINGDTQPIELYCSLLYDSKKETSSFINYGFERTPETSKIEKKDLNGNSIENIIEYNNDNGQKPEYQKFFSDDMLYSHDNIFGEENYYIISEKLPKFNWKIENDTLTILNQKTQKATVKFRGRNYIAWFAPEIYITDGPYKFYGLPGLILKIYTTDEKYKFEAYSLQLNMNNTTNSHLKLTDKYPKLKEITIFDKLKKEKENISRAIKYQKSKDQNVSEVKIEQSGLELNFDDIDEKKI